jgi:hypothetical protein
VEVVLVDDVPRFLILLALRQLDAEPVGPVAAAVLICVLDHGEFEETGISVAR